MNLVTKSLSVLVLAMSINANVFSATVLVTDTDGTLLGANGVEVDGTLYNVSFGDGRIRQAINAFTTSSGALSAASALSSQVLLGEYDLNPGITRGCILASGCYILIPYAERLERTGFGYEVDLVRFYNQEANLLDTITDLTYRSLDPNFYTDDGDQPFTLAVWSVASPTTAVSEPEVFAMIFAGISFIGFVACRKQISFV